MAKLSLEKVKQELVALGYIYVEGEYQNLKSILTIKCSHSHQFLASLEECRRKKQCPSCVSYNSYNEEEEKKMITPPEKKGLRILALDNATLKTGFAIFEDKKLIFSGVKEVSNLINTVERTAIMKQWMVSMVDLWEIDVIGLEDVQLQDNPKVLIILAKLLGTLENAAFESLFSVPDVVSSTVWRAHCGIKGKTRMQKKEAAQDYVKKKYGMVVSQDRADAICLGDYLVEKHKFGKEVTW